MQYIVLAGLRAPASPLHLSNRTRHHLVHSARRHSALACTACLRATSTPPPPAPRALVSCTMRRLRLRALHTTPCTRHARARRMRTHSHLRARVSPGVCLRAACVRLACVCVLALYIAGVRVPYCIYVHIRYDHIIWYMLTSHIHLQNSARDTSIRYTTKCRDSTTHVMHRSLLHVSDLISANCTYDLGEMCTYDLGGLYDVHDLGENRCTYMISARCDARIISATSLVHLCYLLSATSTYI